MHINRFNKGGETGKKQFSIQARSKSLCRYGVAAFVILICAVGTMMAQQMAPAGSIEGVVVDFSGKPIAGADVFIFKLRFSVITKTDENGRFLFKHAGVGPQTLIAYKQSENYPPPGWAFYTVGQYREGINVVKVVENRTTAGVVIRVGPKANRLVVRVVDSLTGEPVADAGISLTHERDSHTLFGPGVTTADGELPVLIPPDIAVNVKASAKGYHPSFYKDESSPNPVGTILFKLGESKTITIKLTRKY